MGSKWRAVIYMPTRNIHSPFLPSASSSCLNPCVQRACHPSIHFIKRGCVCKCVQTNERNERTSERNQRTEGHEGCKRRKKSANFMHLAKPMKRDQRAQEPKIQVKTKNRIFPAKESYGNPAILHHAMQLVRLRSSLQKGSTAENAPSPLLPKNS